MEGEKKKGLSKCEHGKQKYYCFECGGKGMCEHKRKRYNCKECGGKGICKHKRRRYYCTQCMEEKCMMREDVETVREERENMGEINMKGTNTEEKITREENVEKDLELIYAEGQRKMCDHGLVKYFCKRCKGGEMCRHKKFKYLCIDCRRGGLCQHGRNGYVCIECGGKGICEHGKRRYRCRECSDPEFEGMEIRSSKRRKLDEQTDK